MQSEKDFSSIQKRIGITFKNVDLLQHAMVHRSYINENPSFRLSHNERLEFLGDAVLELVVTDYLFATFPKAAEGEMTNWRASLVNSKMLASVAQKLNIESLLYLSRGEAKAGFSKARAYILTNALEALIGAIYLDRGYNTAARFIKKFILIELPGVFEKRLDIDPKSRFQEIAQEKMKITPHYQVLHEEGPDHAKKFRIGIFLGQEHVATGEGTSKQEAQEEAARAALHEKGWE
ncbi:ribonuclease III [Candidatus Uhrbacteria bacterium]|nr:ribonuclease III [Candidatus Uhrbacteria bacterium]